MSRLYTLQNRRITLVVSSRGAEPQSLRLDGRELLWQGEKPYWEDRAIHLFPYIARLTQGCYTHQGRRYRMDIHGFVKDSLLACCEQEPDRLAFQLASSPETLRQYPFPFLYRVSYRLDGTRVHVEYRVENRGDGAMYFGIGGHPGFRVPLEEGRSFDDYRLEFSQPCSPTRILFSPENYVAGRAPYPLAGDQRLPLSHRLFDQDALVLAGTPGSVTLRSGRSGVFLRVDYPGFPYLGLWHSPGTQAPFLCIEPWSSLPSRQGVVEELGQQTDLILLKNGEVYTNEWTITADG